MTKRLICFVLTVLLAASLFACDSSSPAPSDASPTPSVEPSVEPTPTPHGKNYYLTRQLTDSEIADLGHEDIDAAREAICTVADAVAWLDSFGWKMYTGDWSGQMAYTADYRAEVISKGGSTSAAYTAYTAYLLGDDCPELQIITAGYLDDWRMLNGLVIPTESGYWLHSPAVYSQNRGQNDLTTFAPKELESLENIQDSVVPMDMTLDFLAQVFIAPAEQELEFSRGSDGFYSVRKGEAEQVYFMSDDDFAAYAAYLEAQRLEGAEANRQRIEANWDAYGLPEAFAPTMTWEEALALYGESLDVLTEKIQTLGDCILFYGVANFEFEGDINYDDDSGREWYFNFYPETVLKRQKYDCGSSSALIAELLGDSYNIGYIDMGFAKGNGGHVVNWLEFDGRYYVFDMNTLALNDYRASTLRFTESDTLTDAALGYCEKFRAGYIKTMATYKSEYGDCIGFGRVDKELVRGFVTDGCSEINVIFETPDEGYVYEFIELPEELRDTIHSLRMGE